MNPRIILLVSLVLSGNVFAAEKINPPTIEFYEVHGKTARQIRAQMDKLGPLDATEHRRYDGHTQWFIRFNYRTYNSGGNCTLQSFDVSLEGTMTLPRWNPPDGVRKQLVEEWQTFSAALRRHEDGHYEIARAAADEFAKRFAEQLSGATCKTLEDKINATADAILSAYRQKEVEYDQASAHGMRQGAQFPR